MKTVRKRRLKNKTNYKLRIGMLKSGKPRVVVRKTNKYIIIQYVESMEGKDNIKFGISSRELLKNGWPEENKGSLKSISAAYLTGYLFGKKMPKEEVIFDFGLERNIHGSRIYAVLNGLVDGGAKIAYDKKVFPKEERVIGEHLKGNLSDIVKKIKDKIK